MKTSREVYHQIRWDPALDEALFSVGYRERFAGVCEVSFEEFSQQPIPWDRVVYFRLAELIVWDRAERIDRFGDGRIHELIQSVCTGLTSSATDPSNPQRQTAYRYSHSQGRWEQSSQPPTGRRWTPELTVVTWNVLFDLYDRGELDLPGRIPLLLAALQEVDADLVALQEVTPVLLHALLRQPWVRRGYFLSGSPAAETVMPYGPLLLSKFPIDELRFLSHSRDKRSIIARLALGGSSLVVAVVHLPSQRASNPAELRAQHLGELMPFVFQEEDHVAEAWMILGDFNFAPGEEQSLRRNGFSLQDAWPVARPDDPGLTFDPQHNGLARVTSLSGDPARYDRIFFTSGSLTLVPQQSWMLGTLPKRTEGGWRLPSDHFGVACRFRCYSEEQQPTHRSAVVVIPPKESWEPIQALRQRYDRNFRRWMPHINLLYGFLPEEHFPQAAELIGRAVQSVGPFRLRLTQLRSFTHRFSHTLWLEPSTDPPGKLQQLQATLRELFPQCPEQSEKSPWGYTPHLSVGQFSGSCEALADRLQEWQKDWKPLEFPVGEVCFISRRGEEPFELRQQISLSSPTASDQSGSTPAWRTPPAEDFSRDRQRREQLIEILSGIQEEWLQHHGVQPPYRLLSVVGSQWLGSETVGDDLDVLCVGPAEASRQEFLALLEERLRRRGGLLWYRVVEEAVPSLARLCYEGIQVDVQYACFAQQMPLRHPLGLSLSELEQFTPENRQALASVRDGAALLRLLGAKMETFRPSVRWIKDWARRRAIDSTGWGFLGGFGWTLLTAWICQRLPVTAGPEEVICTLFKTLSRWDWREPITLTPESRSYCLAQGGGRPTKPMQIISPTPPCDNTAANVTPGTLSIVRKELTRAEQMCSVEGQPPDWGTILAENAWNFPWYLVLELECASAEEAAKCIGWVEGRFLTLLIQLEKIPGLSIRPIPQRDQVQVEASPPAASPPAASPPAASAPAASPQLATAQPAQQRVFLWGLQGLTTPEAIAKPRRQFESRFAKWNDRPGNGLQVTVRSAEQIRARWPAITLVGAPETELAR